MDKEKVSAVVNWPQPRNLKGLQRFLGFANFYRRFIRNYSVLVSPLTDLTRKGQFSLDWPPAALDAFKALKEAFSSAPILTHPDLDRPFTVEVDASEIGVGAVLSQLSGEPERLHPCAFFSKKFTPAERNYDVGNRELLAMKLALEEWRHWLEGGQHPITVFTDHRNLEYIESAKRLKPRQARWALFFARFKFIVTYKPGSQNVKADALSRQFPESAPADRDPEPILSPGLVVGSLMPDLTKELAEHQGKTPADIPDGKIFVPLDLRPLTLRQFHDSKLAGHLGIQKTLDLVSQRLWWPSLRRDVEEFVQNCTTCARSKSGRTRPAGKLCPLPIPSLPWTHISMDFITDLPVSKGHTTIWVVVDRFSKMAHFIPLPKLPTAPELVDRFTDQIFRLHGLPDEIVSDRGSQFVSRFWRAFCKKLGIQVSLTSAYHPQSNGQTERTNQTLEQYLRCFVSGSQGDWSDLIPFAEFAFNNACSSSSGISPFRCVFGRDLRCSSLTGTSTGVPALDEWLAARERSWEEIQSNLTRATRRQKEFADRRRSQDPDWKKGDLVWLSTRNLALHQPSPKLGPRFIGPYPILSRVNEVSYRLKLPRSLRIANTFHVSLLKPAGPRDASSLPAPILVQGQPEFEVERILDSRLIGRSLQYLVDWKGYGPEERCWVPKSQVHAGALTKKFHREFPGRPGGLGRPESVLLRGGTVTSRRSPPNRVRSRSDPRARRMVNGRRIRSAYALRRRAALRKPARFRTSAAPH